MAKISRIGFLLAIAFAIGAYFIGQRMMTLALWGNLPLYFFILCYASLLAGLSPVLWFDKQSLRWTLLSIISGILLALGFPPLPIPFVLFIAFIPLFILQKEISETNGKNRNIKQWAYAYNTFLLWNILDTFWIANSAVVPAIAAFTINSLFMTIPWMGMIFLPSKLSHWKWPGFICYWICFEFIHQSWEISWPWLTLGNAWAALPSCIQWYDITGTFGGSLWILAVNGLLCKIVFDISIWKKYAAITLAVIILPVSFSLLKWITYKEIGSPVKISIVQPNYEPHYKKFEIPQEEQMLQFEKLSETSLASDIEYLIWPETSFEYIWTNEMDTDWRINRMKKLLDSFPQTCLVSGTTTIHPYASGETPGPAARPSHRNHNEYYEVQNSAIQICGTSKEIPLYLKSKLVPGVEIFPYRKLLPFLKPIVDKLGGTVEGLGTQKDREVFDNGHHKIAPVICYESIYGNYVGGYVRNGAEAIFIMTNDGWWDNTWGHKQHLAFGALRAIEFRRPIARSANSGISCFINSRGDIRQASTYDTASAFTGTLYFSNTKTVYLILGDIIALVSLAGTLFFVGWNLFFRIKLSKRLTRGDK